MATYTVASPPCSPRRCSASGLLGLIGALVVGVCGCVCGCTKAELGDIDGGGKGRGGGAGGQPGGGGRGAGGADGMSDGGPGGPAAGAGGNNGQGGATGAEGGAGGGADAGAGGAAGGGVGGTGGTETGAGGRDGGAGTGGPDAGTGGRDAGAGGTTAGMGGRGGAGGPDASVDQSADVPEGDTGGGPDDAGTAAPTFRVIRLGDGLQALSSAAVRVFIEERRLDNEPALNVIPLPTAVTGTNNPLTMSGTATSEGGLSLSPDGRFLALAGYAAPPGTAGVASTAAATVHRVVGRIDAAGAIDTSTVLATAFDGNNVRSAVTADGTSFWSAGAGNAAGGVRFVSLGQSADVQVVGNPNTVRCVNIFAGQLYASSNSGIFANVFSIGSGLPTIPAAATALPGMTTAVGTVAPSPFAFVLFDLDPTVAGVDTLYVADDRAPPDGGLQKWKFDGTSWTLAAILNLSVAPIGFRGVTGFASAQTVTLIASTADGTANRLVVFVDDGVNITPGLVVATAGPSTIFRGVALSPHN